MGLHRLCWAGGSGNEAPVAMCSMNLMDLRERVAVAVQDGEAIAQALRAVAEDECRDCFVARGHGDS